MSLATFREAGGESFGQPGRQPGLQPTVGKSAVGFDGFLEFGIKRDHLQASFLIAVESTDGAGQAVPHEALQQMLDRTRQLPGQQEA